MKKELKDYLHFYLGCEVMVSSGTKNIVCKIRSIGSNSLFVSGISLDGRTFNYYGDDIKLILRPLSDMNTEEKIRWRLMAKSYQSYAYTVKYFLDRHFDLFGLIESGLAIDKTTINNGTTIKK